MSYASRESMRKQWQAGTLWCRQSRAPVPYVANTTNRQKHTNNDKASAHNYCYRLCKGSALRCGTLHAMLTYTVQEEILLGSTVGKVGVAAAVLTPISLARKGAIPLGRNMPMIAIMAVLNAVNRATFQQEPWQTVSKVKLYTDSLIAWQNVQTSAIPVEALLPASLSSPLHTYEDLGAEVTLADFGQIAGVIDESAANLWDQTCGQWSLTETFAGRLDVRSLKPKSPSATEKPVIPASLHSL